MTIIRNATAYRTMQFYLSQNSSTLNDLYIKTSTGYEVTKASDDPASVSTMINARTAIAQDTRYVANAESVQDNLSTSETYIDSVLEIFDRAREIAVTAANDSLSGSDFATYADEVSQLQDALLDLANTRVDGKYIFAGYNDTTQPFSGDPVTYAGTSDHIMLEVTAGTTMAKNVTGDELFTTPVDLFVVLDDLYDALTSGDAGTISDQLTPLDEAAEQVRTVQSSIGNSSARLDDIISMQENGILQLEEKLSSIQDADLTSVLSEIAKMELSLEATMQVTARVSSLNLFDYL